MEYQKIANMIDDASDQPWLNLEQKTGLNNGFKRNIQCY